MADYAQVVLFGSIGGGWRESHIIPVLEELGVTYYDPVLSGVWNKSDGDREADAMAHCETIVMVINRTSPGFSGLAESGWAALGAMQRSQHFILQVDQDCDYELPESIREVEGSADIHRQMRHYITASRHLVYQHARQFTLDRLHLVDDLDGVAAKLREIYG